MVSCQTCTLSIPLYEPSLSHLPSSCPNITVTSQLRLPLILWKNKGGGRFRVFEETFVLCSIQRYLLLHREAQYSSFAGSLIEPSHRIGFYQSLNRFLLRNIRFSLLPSISREDLVVHVSTPSPFLRSMASTVSPCCVKNFQP